MPSLSEELKSYSAVVVTGGSSGIGKSFINLMGNLCADLVFCNLSRREPAIKNFGKKLNHFPCDLARADEVARPGPDPHQQMPPARHPRQVRVIPKSRDFH